MKNRNLQFNATALRCKSSRRPAVARLLTSLLLACVAVAFISAATPALAGNKDLPFEGTFSGTIPPDLGPPVPGTGGCVFNVIFPNSGTATQLGPFTGSSNVLPNLCDGSNTGSFRWIAANGDEISGTFTGQLIPTATPNVFLNFGTTVITGGRGHFRHATGMFTSYGQANFNTGTFVFPFKGTISKD